MNREIEVVEVRQSMPHSGIGLAKVYKWRVVEPDTGKKYGLCGSYAMALSRMHKLKMRDMLEELAKHPSFARVVSEMLDMEEE